GRAPGAARPCDGDRPQREARRGREGRKIEERLRPHLARVSDSLTGGGGARGAGRPRGILGTVGALRIGLVYDLLGTYPRRPGDPPDVDAEYEPEETVRALEGALRRLGCEPVRLGRPHALLARIRKGEPPALDAPLSLPEGV